MRELCKIIMNQKYTPARTNSVMVCLLSVSAVVQHEEHWLTQVLNIVLKIWVSLVGGSQHCMAVDGNGLKSEFYS